MDESFRTTIRTNLRTQDNRATHLPVFCVQQRRRIWGMDPAYAMDNIVWVDENADYAEVTDEGETAALEELWNDTGEEPDGYRRTAYVDVWDFVTACFTEKGAEDYLRLNGHNLTEPRIYVESAHRNHEWEVVRDFLMADVPELLPVLERWRTFYRSQQGPVMCKRDDGFPCGEAAHVLEAVAHVEPFHLHRALGRPMHDGFRLVKAIRRFTWDMPNDQPNGETEAAILDLETALRRGDLDAARRAFSVMMRASADDVTELREAAERAIPGVDFKGVINPTPCRSVMLGAPLFSFDSLQQWVNKGRSWYATCGFGEYDIVTLDAIGRVVKKGAEFMRADREGTYPITVYPIDPNARPSAEMIDAGTKRELETRAVESSLARAIGQDDPNE